MRWQWNSKKTRKGCCPCWTFLDSGKLIMLDFMVAVSTLLGFDSRNKCIQVVTLLSSRTSLIFLFSSCPFIVAANVSCTEIAHKRLYCEIPGRKYLRVFVLWRSLSLCFMLFACLVSWVIPNLDEVAVRLYLRVISQTEYVTHSPINSNRWKLPALGEEIVWVLWSG